MKKLAAILAAAAMCAACTKEIAPVENNQVQDGASISFSATFEQFGSKTVTDLDNVTRWVTGDVITITDNETDVSYQYKVKEGGSAVADFEPVDPSKTIPAGKASYDLWAVYADGVAAEQTNVGGRTSEAPLTATYSGAAENGAIKLQFGQNASLITFSFVDASNSNAPLALSSLVIESVGGEEIADGSPTITVTPEGDATSTCQTVVSKVALSKGLLVKATAASAAASASDGTEFPAGTQFCKIIKQGGADLSSTSGTHAVVTVLLNQQGISSKADLVSFGYVLEHKLSVSNYIGATYTNGGHATPEISVLADIDMGGTAAQPIDWHPIGELCSEDETLRYYFNGHNHNIYNFNVVTDASYFGLFGDVYDVTYWGGQIVNLNLGTRDGESWDGVSRIKLEADGIGDHYVGTFIGRVKKNSKGNGNWQMLGCKNFVPIEISANNWDKAYVGGFVGNASRVLFKNCKNYGDITNNSSKYGICIGGFAGVVWDKLTQKFDTCENHGNITVNDNGVQYVGGFVSRFTTANPESSNVNTFTNCRNTGNITVKAVSTAIRIGGIVGDVIANDTYPASFENCVNEGEISVACDGTMSSADLISTGGIAGRGEAPVTYTSCSNKGDIAVELSNEGLKAGVRVGGIYGDNTSMDNDCTECENTGAVEVQYVTGDATSVENYCVGGIAGRISACTGDGQDGSVLRDCTNGGDLYVKGNRATMGGIVGAMADGSVIGCINKNEVYAKYNKSTKRQVIVGGIAGDVWGAAKEITNCTNEGLVFAKTLTNSQAQGNLIGGIAGWTEEDATALVVSGCENKGEVTGGTCTDNTACAPYVGGIIGYKECRNKDFDNVNRGNVTALATNSSRHAAAGGIVGVLRYGTIEACWNYGTIEAGEKSSAYNDVNATYSNGRAGSIAGWYYTSADGPYPACEGTITKCYVGGAVKAKHTSGNLVTITADNYGSNIVGRGDDPTDCYFVGSQDQSLAVLYWNIQNGMCADQVNNYSNFNSWVSSQNPDICVWCEAAKVYKDSGAELGYNSWTGERTIPSFNYGHTTTACPYKKTDYPNMLTVREGLSFTSKTSIKDNERQLYTKVKVGGKEINIVTVHLSKSVTEGVHEGFAEIRAVLAATVEKSANPNDEYWMIIGDFNAICESDNNLPNSPYASWTNDATTGKPKALSFAVINEVLNHSAGFKDCIAEKHPGQFVSTRYYDQRIDYVFCNPKLYSCLDSIEIPAVNFGDNYQKFTLGSQTEFRSPSDHKPVKIKFTI